MKKIIRKIGILVAAVMMLGLTACGNSENMDRLIEERTQNDTTTEKVKDTTDSTTEADSQKDADAGEADAATGKTDPGETTSDELSDGKTTSGEIADDPATAGAGKDDNSGSTVNDIDIDLTALSSTMVYSEIYNMLVDPAGYLGKTVKVNGSFDVYENQDTGERYYACVIADSTACCVLGMEFVLAGDYKYPDDYPELGGEITVSGIFDTYEEDGYIYGQLLEAKME